MIVFITNRDLLDSPRALVRRVIEMGGTPVVVDNDTEHQPTLDWYATEPCLVERTGGNYGQRAAWDTGAVARYSHGPYVVTDSDLNIDECPDDTLEHLAWLLEKNPDREKVGLSLRISDIPMSNPDREFIIRHEWQFWTKRRPLGFDADIETTFAAYRHGEGWRGYQAMRTDWPYTAVHTPWYWDRGNMPEDAKCYLRRAVRQWTGYTARMP